MTSCFSQKFIFDNEEELIREVRKLKSKYNGDGYYFAYNALLLNCGVLQQINSIS